jgi:hypothetical protein
MVSKDAPPFDLRVKAVIFDLDGTIGNTLPRCHHGLP